MFAELDKLWGPHTVDRFASYLNKQLPRFNSYLFDRHAETVNCFSTPWVHGRSQLGQPTLRSAAAGGAESDTRRGNNNNNSTPLAKSAMVPPVTTGSGGGGGATQSSGPVPTRLFGQRGTAAKPAVEGVRLASLLATSLQQTLEFVLPPHAVAAIALSKKPNTWKTYSQATNAFLRYCADTVNELNPMGAVQQLVTYLTMKSLASPSRRPRATLMKIITALSLYYKLLGYSKEDNPANHVPGHETAGGWIGQVGYAITNGACAGVCGLYGSV